MPKELESTDVAKEVGLERFEGLELLRLRLEALPDVLDVFRVGIVGPVPSHAETRAAGFCEDDGRE